MAELTASEVVQVLNRITPDGTIYCLDEEAGGLIYAAAKSKAREGLYTVADRMRVDEGIKRIGVVLSMGPTTEDEKCQE